MKDITICSKCGSINLYVCDSRKDCGRIRRRKKCKDCGYRFTTYEIPASEFAKIDRSLKLIAELQSIGSIFDEIRAISEKDEEIIE